jgi:predicted transcriptional regulator
MERPTKATRLTVSLEEQDYQALNEIARERDASLSWVIRQAIRHFINDTPSRMRQRRGLWKERKRASLDGP